MDVPISINEVGYGDVVLVRYLIGPDEVIPDICPAPVTADSVTVLQSATGGTPESPDPVGGTHPQEAPEPHAPAPDDGDARDSAPESTPEPSTVASAFAALGDKASVLPDTGGGSLLAALAGTTLIVGGLIVHRKLRR